MKIWIITVGEPLPIGDDDIRLLRTGLLATQLLEYGHDVIWWTSTFDHSNKVHLFHDDTKISIAKTFSIIMLHAMAYKKNVSIARVLNHICVAHKFRRYSVGEPVPDIILCSIPTLELGVEAIRYGMSKNLPVIIDLRDMWPVMFAERLPTNLKWLFKLPMAYMTHQLQFACRGAKGIIGITPEYVEWGLKNAGRDKGEFDIDFPLGYSSVKISADKIREAEKFWEARGVTIINNDFILCLFSNLVRQLDLETVIEAARRLEKTNKKFKFVFCGKGEAVDYFKSRAEGCASVHFPGWVSMPQIAALMKISQVGLAPYRSTKDFKISIPNKAIEYMSAGLPIISSLKGSLQKLLSEHKAGLTYDNNNCDELIDILCDLYDNREKLEVMSTNSHELYKKKFEGIKIYTSMCKYLEKVASSSTMQGN